MNNEIYCTNPNISSIFAYKGRDIAHKLSNSLGQHWKKFIKDRELNSEDLHYISELFYQYFLVKNTKLREHINRKDISDFCKYKFTEILLAQGKIDDLTLLNSAIEKSIEKCFFKSINHYFKHHKEELKGANLKQVGEGIFATLSENFKEYNLSLSAKN